MKLKSFLASAALAVALVISALAQTPGPALTPTSAGGCVDYAIYFSRSLSQVMTQGEQPLNLGPTQQLTDANGCTVSYQEDGNIVCFMSTSCTADSDLLPFCALGFSGPPGITIGDVAVLRTLTDQASPSPSGVTIARIGGSSGGNGPQAIYKGLPK